MVDADGKPGYALPATTPSTHVPTLPPRGPTALRYVGVVLFVACALVVVVVVSLALFLPTNSPPTTTTAPPTTTNAPTTEPPKTTTTTTTTTPPDPMEDLAPVPLQIGPNDVRASVERTLKKRGLRDGDVPALDALIDKATKLEKQKHEGAVDAWRAADAYAARVVVDRGFVFSKQKRLRLALEERGAKDARRVDDLVAEVERRFANGDYDGCNDALNKAFLLLK